MVVVIVLVIILDQNLTMKKETHAQNQLCKIKCNVLSQFLFFKSHNFLDNFTSFGVLFGTSVH